ncbi:MAG TPA: universal stress protein [Streptosporangiaceae bacterium]
MYVERVIAGVSGSAGSLQALRHAAEMAESHDAALIPVLAWIPPGGDLADRRSPCPPLREAWKRAACDRLRHAIDLGIGQPPEGLPFTPQVVRGQPGEVLTEVAALPGDVLVIGAGRHGSVRRLLTAKVSRYCVAHAVCPVISVPPSALASEVHGLRGWVARRHLDPEDAALHGAGA